MQVPTPDQDLGAVLGREVARWLSLVLPGEQLTAASLLGGGYSNHNTRLDTAAGRSYVLRQYRSAQEAGRAERDAGPDDPGRAETDAGRTEHDAGRAENGAGQARRTCAVEDALARRLRGVVPVPGVVAALRSLAVAYGPLADRAGAASQLAHSDFNPKNLLVARESGHWSVTAVLDWEFAFSGSPLHDVGNMLRFADEIPPAFAAGFSGGFGAAGGDLPPDWREISRALDLYALAELLTRPVGHRYFGKAVAAIRASLTGW